MSKTIYAVSAGCYSDYSVLAVFSSKDKAQAYIDAFSVSGSYRDFNDIEEYALDPYSAELGKGLRLRRVVMFKNGDVESVELSAWDAMDGEKVIWNRQMYGKSTEPWTNFYVWSRDDKHAVKVANERRIAAIAAATGEP